MPFQAIHQLDFRSILLPSVPDPASPVESLGFSPECQSRLAPGTGAPTAVVGVGDPSEGSFVMSMRRLGAVSATFILLVSLLAPSAMASALEDLGTHVDLGAVVRQALDDLWVLLGARSHERTGELTEATTPFYDPATLEVPSYGGSSEIQGDTQDFGCSVDPHG